MSSVPLVEPTISSHPPSLPSELIDEILREETLSKSDLLSCCLVGHQFLPIPRQRLYSTAQITLCLINKYGKISGTFRRRDQTSELLLRTWRESPFLCQQVTKLHVNGIQVTTDDYLVQSQDVASTLVALQVSEILDLLPRLESFKVSDLVWKSLWVQELVVERGEQWRELDLEGSLTDESSETGKKGYGFPNLRNLRCQEVTARQAWSKMAPLLETLEIRTHFGGPFPTSPPPTLRVLSAFFSKLRYVVHYSHLAHLHLLFDTELHPDSGVLAAFSKLPHLETLSITIVQETRPSLASTLPHLSPFLSSALSHPILPRQFPIDTLSSFVSPDVDLPPRLRVFRLHLPGWDLNHQAANVEALKQLCRGKGIVYEHTPNRQDVFRMFRFSLILLLDPTPDPNLPFD